MAEQKSKYDGYWNQMLTVGPGLLHAARLGFRLLPAQSRCSVCHAPFSGRSGKLVGTVFKIAPSRHNPSYCNNCEYQWQQHPGGAEVPVALMFADVRGSTTLAEGMSASEFSVLMDRFFRICTDAVVETGGVIEKFVGDEAATIYVPGFAGEDYVQQAIRAAQLILERTGNADPEGAWLPVGAGVHFGPAFVGMVGSERATQLSVLGDTANTTARLASNARKGEVLVSDAAFAETGRDAGTLEHRALTLKGKAEPFGVYVLPVRNEGE